MALKFKTFISMLLSTILAFLGFNSCKKGLNIGEAVCMYGVPYAEFTLKGTVSTEQKDPIEGIKVNVVNTRSEGETSYTDTLYSGTTDSNGKIEAKFSDFGFNDFSNMSVELTDIDGPANGGQFVTKKISANAKKTGKGDSSWKTGEYEIKFSETLTKE